MSAPVRVRDKKNDAILRAATKLFLTHGYANTTMDKVAQQAGVTKQTVYAHYTSKEQLFTLMLNAVCTRHTPGQLHRAKPNVSFESLLNRVGLALLETMTSPEGLGATRLVIAESQRHPELAALYYERGTQLLVQLVADFIKLHAKNPALAIHDALSAASYFLALLKGQYYVRIILRVKPIPSPTQKKAHVAEVVKIFMHLYGKKHPLITKSRL